MSNIKQKLRYVIIEQEYGWILSFLVLFALFCGIVILTDRDEGQGVKVEGINIERNISK